MASVSAVNCVFLVCLCMGLVSYADSKCPRDPRYGKWIEDTRNDRCILRCFGGFEPSGCHVIRYSHREGKWNHDVPSCQEEPLMSGRTKAALAVGAGAVVAVPAALAVAGFGAAGVIVGSFAAMVQTPFTAAGGWFALSQSAGVIGTAATTKGAVGAVTGAITYAASSMFSNCDQLHGYWDEDTRNNRFILRCDSGYEPSGCHIIRYSQKQRKWNHEPSCQKEWPVSGKTLMAVGTGVAAVVVTPVLLAGARFMNPGVAAGFIAAMPHVHV